MYVWMYALYVYARIQYRTIYVKFVRAYNYTTYRRDDSTWPILSSSVAPPPSNNRGALNAADVEAGMVSSAAMVVAIWSGGEQRNSC